MKEIVITNKNGITLSTKNTLVNDDIKIKLDNSIKAIDGVTETDTGILLVETPKEKEITILGNHDTINVTNGSVKLNLNAYAEITLSDNSEMNLITANGLEPQNIKKDVTILGVTGTFEGGSGGNTLKAVLDATKSAKNLFYDYKGDNLSDLIQYNDTENVEEFSYMFGEANNITILPALNTSKGKNFENFLSRCMKLTTIQKLNTSNAESLSYMCYYNYQLISLPQLYTNNVIKWSSAFYNCNYIKKIDISKFTSSSTTNSQNMCNSCYNLKALIIRSFGDTYVLHTNSFNNCYHILGIQHSSHNPNGDQDGYIYVPRDMIETLSNATNWSTYATQFRALEDYTLDGTTTGEFDDVKAGLV